MREWKEILDAVNFNPSECNENVVEEYHHNKTSKIAKSRSNSARQVFRADLFDWCNVRATLQRYVCIPYLAELDKLKGDVERDRDHDVEENDVAPERQERKKRRVRVACHGHIVSTMEMCGLIAN
jgi:hypothetical protein